MKPQTKFCVFEKDHGVEVKRVVVRPNKNTDGPPQTRLVNAIPPSDCDLKHHTNLTHQPPTCSI